MTEEERLKAKISLLEEKNAILETMHKRVSQLLQLKIAENEGLKKQMWILEEEVKNAKR